MKHFVAVPVYESILPTSVSSRNIGVGWLIPGRRAPMDGWVVPFWGEKRTAILDVSSWRVSLCLPAEQPFGSQNIGIGGDHGYHSLRIKYDPPLLVLILPIITPSLCNCLIMIHFLFLPSKPSKLESPWDHGPYLAWLGTLAIVSLTPIVGAQEIFVQRLIEWIWHFIL